MGRVQTTRLSNERTVAVRVTEAQKRAKTDDKLVFVLHLSGNIEDPGFT